MYQGRSGDGRAAQRVDYITRQGTYSPAAARIRHQEAAGHVARLHPDTLVDRGLDRTPEPRLAPSDSNALKYHGRITERMQEVLGHRQARQQYAPKEQVQACAYWEARKQTLGITRDLSMQEKLEHIREARTHTITHAPDRLTLAQLREQERTLEKQITDLELHVRDLQLYGRREQRLDQRREHRAWKQELAAERVLAAGKNHGLPRDRQAEQMVARLEQAVRAQETVQQLRGLASWVPCAAAPQRGPQLPGARGMVTRVAGKMM